MTTILDDIIVAKLNEITALWESRPLELLREQAAAMAPALDFAGALRLGRPREGGGEVNIIAEIKRRSPSKGEFPWDGDGARLAGAYQQGGAKAISVVTDTPFFGGSLELLQEVKAAVTLPVLQKDFLIDPYQLYLARALGADAALLIASILPEALLGEMLAIAGELGLATLVEVTGREELEAAIRQGAAVIGVNNRDLHTFEVDTNRTLELMPHFTDEQVAVTESGIRSRQDIVRMQQAGVDGFLIGEALVCDPDPAALLRRLRGVGEEGRG